MHVELTPTQETLRGIGRAARKNAAGKELKKQMTRDLRAGLKPVVADARAAVMSIPSSRSGSPPLRASIRRRIGVSVRASGRNPSVQVRARRTPNVRGFAHAPKRTQGRRGWLHPVFVEGGDTVVIRQTGKPRWFDDTTSRHRRRMRQVVVGTLDRYAKAIADTVR